MGGTPLFICHLLLVSLTLPDGVTKLTEVSSLKALLKQSLLLTLTIQSRCVSDDVPLPCANEAWPFPMCQLPHLL